MPIPKTFSRPQSFVPWLRSLWASTQTHLCIGLDPVRALMPASYADRSDGLLAFCQAMVDVTSPYVCAFKPQIACFAREGAEDQLSALIDYIHRHTPQIPVILDAKRADIGVTAEHYAEEAFTRYNADAVTVNPFLGWDGIEPYTRWLDRGVFVLCRTSNPSGCEVQSRVLADGGMLFEWLASRAATDWNVSGQLGLVAGALALDDLRRIRRLVGEMPLLVPGVGAQGGSVQAVVQAGGASVVVNISRSVLYAGSGSDCFEKARCAARQARDDLRTALVMAGLG